MYYIRKSKSHNNVLIVIEKTDKHLLRVGLITLIKQLESDGVIERIPTENYDDNDKYPVCYLPFYPGEDCVIRPVSKYKNFVNAVYEISRDVEIGNFFDAMMTAENMDELTFGEIDDTIEEE